MLELNITKNTDQTSQAKYGKYYARVEYKKTMSISDMAKHMAEHHTPFSEGTILGILKDFVACTREMCLMGNTVKIDDLAIFKCSIEANGLQLPVARRLQAHNEVIEIENLLQSKNKTNNIMTLLKGIF